jgi:hypothetical protein
MLARLTLFLLRSRPMLARRTNLLLLPLRSHPRYDANLDTPWSLEASLNGTVTPDEISVSVNKLHLYQKHGDKAECSSELSAEGTFAISLPPPSRSANAPPRPADSVAATLIKEAISQMKPPAPNTNSPRRRPPTTTHPSQRTALSYNYTLTLLNEAVVDVISISMRASHPMLNGCSDLAFVMEQIYAGGYVKSPADAKLYLPPKKRDILRSLPVIDVKAG